MNRTLTSSDAKAKFKEEAAKRAVQFVQSGMKVGLGTGSTAIFATRRIAVIAISFYCVPRAGFLGQ